MKRNIDRKPFDSHCVRVPNYGLLTVISSKEYFSEDWEYVGEDEYSGYTVVYSPSINAYCVVLLEN